MANSFFRIKQGLSLTPVDDATITNPEAGDVIIDSSDGNKMKVYDVNAASWTEVGGADPSQLLDNPQFEAGVTGWTLTAGTASSSSEAVVGTKSLQVDLSAEAFELYQDSTKNVTALADGVQGICYIRVKSDVAGVKVCSRNAGVTSTSLCVDVSNDNRWGLYKIPFVLGGTSNGISVNSDSVALTGTILVDDAFLGAQDVKQDAVSITKQYLSYSGANSTYSLESGTMDGEGLFSVSGDTVTALGNITIAISNSVTASASSSNGGCYAYIATPSGVTVTDRGYHAVSSGPLGSNSSATFPMVTGQTAVLSAVCSSATVNGTRVHIDAWYAQTESIYSTAADSFSTDTHTLTHKTTAITSSDPVGTYNTYSYAINSNTKTICATAPTTASTKADGFLIYTRAYNAASTCGSPVRVEIKIAEAGTSLPTLQMALYKDSGKSDAGVLEYIVNSSSSVSGARLKTYSEETGVLIIDSGNQALTTITGAIFIYAESNTSATSGYLVINAQKMKDSVVGSFKEVVTTPGVTKPVKIRAHVAGGTSSSSCSASPCTVYRNYGFGVIGRSGVGTYSVAFTNSFSEAPVCHVTTNRAGSNVFCGLNGEVSTSGASVKCMAAASEADSFFDISCDGNAL